MYYLSMLITFNMLINGNPAILYEQSFTGPFITKEVCEEYGATIYINSLENPAFDVNHFECIIKDTTNSEKGQEGI